MTHPPRGRQAQEAYQDFLIGLAAVGAQEHLVGAHGGGSISHTGAKIPDAEQDEIGKLLMPDLAQLPNHDARGGLHPMAEWERFVQLRATGVCRVSEGVLYSTPWLRGACAIRLPWH